MEQDNSSKPNIAIVKMEAKKSTLYPALASLLLGVGYYFYASYLDGLTESTKINAIIAIIYNSMGTMGGTAMFGGITALLLVAFLVKWMKIKKLEQLM